MKSFSMSTLAMIAALLVSSRQVQAKASIAHARTEGRDGVLQRRRNVLGLRDGLYDALEPKHNNDTGKGFEEPFDSDPGSVAQYLERLQGLKFFTEGTKPLLDIPPDDKRALNLAFEERPDLFGNCLLIRDYAEPLRVGSAISRSRHKLHARETAVRDSDRSGSSPDNDTDVVNATKLPDGVLFPKGGVADKGGEMGDGPEGAQLEVTMFAYLKTIAGEVAVIPNGITATWSSKKKVPIAGYLCIEEGNSVLYSLPTPCLETALGDDGVPRLPPDEGSANANVGEASGNASLLLARRALLQSGLSPHDVTPTSTGKFHAYVGGTELRFSSRLAAEGFCTELAEKIADDMGDIEWDADSLRAKDVGTDISSAAFVQLARKPPPADWTLGTKSLLVVVMDWTFGDRTRRPLSKQSLTPAHYSQKIFPRVRKAFRRMSYGKFDLSVTVVPEVVRFARSRRFYAAGGYPFPALYNGARDSLAGHRTLGAKYKFDDYDLVFVIAPQQAPVGTKGVAWVGAKGAICNGCEAISENFRVMVAVHELGHNLGLAHAGSKSLEYGNPFDWMGNYPDVTGLSYGAGYKLKLGWLKPTSIAMVDDQHLAGLNDLFILKPFDTDEEPGDGDLVGIQLRLKKNQQDIYISYRQTAGQEAGVYVVLQDKGKPDSMLVDMACHTPSQKDAQLRPGWTFVDPSSQVVVVVQSLDKLVAKVHLYKLPASDRKFAAIRARSNFTDGTYKCPRTCTDSDLLVANFESCAALAKSGYCNGGKITMSGQQYSVAMELCPRSCGHCAEVTSGSPVVGSGVSGGCSDKNVKIGGYDCRGAARTRLCDRSTNIGNVGRDLCPKSCGKCPPRPPSSAGVAPGDPDPTPVRTRGLGGAAVPAEEDAKPSDSQPESDTNKEGQSTTVDAGKRDDGVGGAEACSDDAAWRDEDDHGCEVYAEYITTGKLSQEHACFYGDGAANDHCRKTCGTCDVGDGEAKACEDKEYVSKWYVETGQRFTCADHASHCTEKFFASDCRLTCGACTSTSSAPSAAPAKPHTTEEETCVDKDCVESWMESFNTCYKCSEFAATYCGQDVLFMRSCPKSCKLCSADGVPTACADDFDVVSCHEYKARGWCDQPKVARHCKESCGLCGAAAAALSDDQGATLSRGMERGATLENLDWQWGSPDIVKRAAVQANRAAEIRAEKLVANLRGNAAPRFRHSLLVTTIAIVAAYALQ